MADQDEEVALPDLADAEVASSLDETEVAQEEEDVARTAQDL